MWAMCATFSTLRFRVSLSQIGKQQVRHGAYAQANALKGMSLSPWGTVGFAIRACADIPYSEPLAVFSL
jgi:hypothetical protein